MAIETLEDWNTRLGYCGCCDMPSCPVVTMDCQSIDTSACGYSLPAHPDLPEEEACWLFEKKNEETHFDEDLDDGVTVYHDNEDFYTTWQMWDAGDGCGERVFSTRAHEDESLVVTIGGDIVSDQRAVIDVSSSLSATCTGTYSYTDGVDPENSHTETIDYGCREVDHTPDASWTYSAHSYSLSGDLPSGDPDMHRTFSYVVSYTDRITKEKLVEQLTRIEDHLPEGSAWPGTSCESRHSAVRTLDDDGNTICQQSNYVQKVRYRWKIPASWAGTYFKITWDIVFFPDGWDATIDDPDYVPPDPLPDPPPPIPQIPDPDAPPPSFVAEDLTYEWTGGGRTSGWNEIDVPTEEGESRIVNTRFVCYRSPYGVMPQVTGEAYEPPA